MLIRHLKTGREKKKKRENSKFLLNIRDFKWKESIGLDQPGKQVNSGLLVKGQINTTDYKAQVFCVWEGRVTTMPNWTVLNRFRPGRHSHMGTRC